jgi:hypothetical protein
MYLYIYIYICMYIYLYHKYMYIYIYIYRKQQLDSAAKARAMDPREESISPLVRIIHETCIDMYIYKYL